MSPTLACFVSPHGFGHAARTSAVLAALAHRQPELRFELFTTVPRWFFDDSLGGSFGYHALACDVGLVQTDALNEDLGATLTRLRELVPFRPGLLHGLAEQLRALEVGLVVCDVAPLGLAAARTAGLPSVLIENFTWDWIYRGYADEEPALLILADELAQTFATTSLRIQTEPCCNPAPGALTVAPVSRAPRTDRAETRRRLGIPEDEPAVLVTMGGIEHRYPSAEQLGRGEDEPWLIIPGAAAEPQTHGRRVLLPHRSAFYHPDLIAAADAVIAKLGYSTLAEVDRAGLPLGFVPRARFPESPVLERWVRSRLECLEVDPSSLGAARLGAIAGELVRLPRRPPAPVDGAATAAAAILEIIGSGRSRPRADRARRSPAASRTRG